MDVESLTAELRNTCHFDRINHVPAGSAAGHRAWIQEVTDPEAQLRLAVLNATVQTLGGTTVDTVLSDGRQDMVDMVTRRAQAWLDERESGVSLVSLELLDLGPPQQVQEAFRDVQTAAIESETLMRSAREYQEVQVPKARTDKRRLILAAEAEAFAGLQQARSEASAFEVLVAEYRKDPGVVRERLYREGVEAVLEDAGKVDFLPPPSGGRYKGTRLTLPVGGLRSAGVAR